MARTYLVRGMLAGFVAALFAVAFAKVVAEPQIARAESVERRIALQLHRPLPAPVVSRAVQDSAGLGTGVAVAGVALGGLYGIAFAALHRRLIHARARATSALLAVAAFMGLFLVPFLKYPALPPSAGDPGTIGRRTALYLLLVVVGVLAVALAVIVRQLSIARFGPWNAGLLGFAAFVAAVGFSYAATPGSGDVVAGLPAELLWRFRLASVGTQMVLWAALAVVFGALTERHEAHLVAGPST